MQKHVKILGIVHLAIGAIGVFFALLCLLFFVIGLFGIGQGTDALIAVPTLGAQEALILTVIALMLSVDILAGYGLLKRKPWARILVIVLSVMNLVSVPVGTVIGVYSLWVLLHKETKLMFLHPVTRPISF